MNNTTKTILIVIAAALVGGVIVYALTRPAAAPTEDHTATTTGATATTTATPDVSKILSFQACQAAGYPVTGTSPRQCKLPDGRVYAEEVAVQPTYTNATADMIRAASPYPGAVTGRTFTVTGQARGTWYSEAVFPVEVRDKDGKVLATATANAQGEWMTENFVPFIAHVSVPQSYSGPATLVLKKDNPSGLPSKDASMSFPITISY